MEDRPGGGWCGGAICANSTVDGEVQWTQTEFENTSNTTVDITVPYESGNSVQVQMWWIGDGDADLELTLTKTDADEGATE